MDFTVLSNGYSLSPYINFKNRFNIDNWIFENEPLLRSNNMITPEIERKLWNKKEKDFWAKKYREREEQLIVDSYFGNDIF